MKEIPGLTEVEVVLVEKEADSCWAEMSAYGFNGHPIERSMIALALAIKAKYADVEEARIAARKEGVQQSVDVAHDAILGHVGLGIMQKRRLIRDVTAQLTESATWKEA